MRIAANRVYSVRYRRISTTKRRANLPNLSAANPFTTRDDIDPKPQCHLILLSDVGFAFRCLCIGVCVCVCVYHNSLNSNFGSFRFWHNDVSTQIDVSLLLRYRRPKVCFVLTAVWLKWVRPRTTVLCWAQKHNKVCVCVVELLWPRNQRRSVVVGVVWLRVWCVFWNLDGSARLV